MLGACSLIPLIKISLICMRYVSPPCSLSLQSVSVCMYICVYTSVHVLMPVYAGSGRGPGRDNEIITLIKPLQTEWSSLFCSCSLPCLLVFAAPVSASALVSQADSLTDSPCHSHAAASARDAAVEAYAANPAAVYHVVNAADFHPWCLAVLCVYQRVHVWTEI